MAAVWQLCKRPSPLKRKDAARESIEARYWQEITGTTGYKAYGEEEMRKRGKIVCATRYGMALTSSGNAWFILLVFPGRYYNCVCPTCWSYRGSRDSSTNTC